MRTAEEITEDIRTVVGGCYERGSRQDLAGCLL
jgi:hypothetical protein